MKISVTVDPNKCAISGRCAAVAPDMFDLPERGAAYPLRTDWGLDDLELLREAQDECPSGAITVTVEED
jgi:ferredoxin